jgi:hypothetical protein
MKVKSMKKGNNKKINTFKNAENAILELMGNASFKSIGEKMLATMKDEMKKKVEIDFKASYIAPREVEYSLVEHKLPEHLKYGSGKKGRKGRVYIHKGEYYNLPELCELFNLRYTMVNQRIKSGWNMVRVFGVENHRIDNFIADNMEMMKK